MSDRIKKIKVKKQDGSFTDYIPIGADAENIDTADGESVELKLNKKPYYYNTVADMKADTKLKIGDMAITLGYYEANDGGGATYRIRTKTENDVEDGGSIHFLSNAFVAELIIKNQTINFRQLGAKSATSGIITDCDFDCKDCMQKYIDLCDKNNITYKLYIPTGYWCFSDTHIYRNLGVNIVGEPIFPGRTLKGTIIIPIDDNQSYIWKIGGDSDVSDKTGYKSGNLMSQVHLDGLTFSTKRGNTRYKVTDGTLYLDLMMYCTFDNIYFYWFEGNGLVIRSSWEIYWGILNFRNQYGFNYTNLLFADVRPISGIAANISALDIQTLMFEGADGDYIYSEPDSGFSHNHIGHLNIENGWSSGTKSTLKDITDEQIESYIPKDVIKGFYRFFVIDSINIVDNNCNVTADEDGNTYYRRSIICDDCDIELAEYKRRLHIAVGTLIFRNDQSYNRLSVVHSYYARKNNQISIGNLVIQDNIPIKPLDLKYSPPVTIGACNFTGFNYKCDENSAYLFSRFGTSYGSVSYDETSSNFYRLVHDKAKDDGSYGLLYRFNKISSAENLKTLKMIVKNLSEESIKITIYLRHDGAKSWQTITVPVSTEWQEVSLSIYADYGSDLEISNSGNYKADKIWIE